VSQEVTPQGTIAYTYDGLGRRTSMTVLGQPTVSYTSDAADRLTQITQGTTTVTLAYDTADRRTSLTLPNGVVTEYSYDAASRLVGQTFKNGAAVLGTLSYGYDAAGNRLQTGGSWARTGIPSALSGATYNAANHQVTFGSQTQTFDLNGNLTSDGTTTYTWDPRNRLTGLTRPGLTATFEYDPLGRRTRKVINGTETKFHYDGVNPVQELSGAAVVANLLTALGIDEFFSRTDAGGTRSHLTDILGSTIAELSGSVVTQAEHTYEPFGATTTTGSTGNGYQYTGRENDGTGLYYYRARYYHPGLQRFISEDPIGFAGGDPNLYAYVHNSPLNFRDPSGNVAIADDAVILVGLAALGAMWLASPQGQQAINDAVGAIGAAVGELIRSPARNDPGAGQDVMPDHRNPPPGWGPLGPGTWRDPATGEVWHWHDEPGHGGPHWDIGGPRLRPGEKGKQEWWPVGGKRGPKPPGELRFTGCRKC
jgi:RHS repeat-associated protein